MGRPTNPYTGKRRKSWRVVRTEEDVLTLARRRTADAFARFDHVAVLFSGGKDSTVTLMLAVEAAEAAGRLPLRVIFIDEEAIPYETEAYVRRVAADPRIEMEWYAIPVKHRNACSRESPYWYPWAPEAEDLWVRPLPPEARIDLPGYPRDRPEHRLLIPDLNGLFFPASLGNVGMLMGIRTAESMNRRRAIANTLHEPWLGRYTTGATEKGNVWKVYPIYDWLTTDIWLAIGRFGWDYNAAYDHMELGGISHHAQRCAPPYGEEPLANLGNFARCFPDVWDRMAARVPGAAAAATYAKTELWALGRLPDKPDGMTWPAYLSHFIEQHPPRERSFIAKRIARELETHYSRTSQPPVERAVHPDTGLTWRYLLAIAVRGDFKMRRSTTQTASPIIVRLGRDEVRRRYEDERAAIRAAGREDEIRP